MLRCEDRCRSNRLDPRRAMMGPWTVALRAKEESAAEVLGVSSVVARRKDGWGSELRQLWRVKRRR